MTIPTGFSQDVRYAIRTLRRAPGFTLGVVLILTLGIGANTAIFSLVSAVMLRPLPFPDPDRLVTLWADFSAVGGPTRVEPAPANFVDWKARSRSFEDIAALSLQSYNLTGDGEPERLSALRTTPNLFAILGMQPLLGRTFAADETAESSSAIVVSERLWRRRFGGESDVIGRTLVLDGTGYTVVGIVPTDFRFPNADTDVWMPTTFTPDELASRGSYYFYLVARLKPSVTLPAAQAEMTAIARALELEYPESFRNVGVSVAGLHEHLSLGTRPTLFALLGAVSLVLLIACANVANLLLARNTTRHKELAVRKALGAGYGRVLRQLLAESTVLAGLGVVLGTALAVASFDYLARLVPGHFPGGTSPELDWRVLVFTAGTALLTVLLFGAGPAFVAARRESVDVLRRSQGLGATSRGNRLRSALVVGEITLTVMLLAAAGLLLRSYAEVLAADPGYRPDNLLVAETVLPSLQYRDDERRLAFYDGVLERVRALPGVTSAGYANFAPLLFKGGRVAVTIEGRPPPGAEDLQRSMTIDRVVSAGYFSALGVPLLAGRDFDTRDTESGAPTAVVNRAMARAHWPDEDPLGKRFRFGRGDELPWITVVGVIGDVRQMGLDAPAEPEMYLPMTQTVVDSPFFWPRHLIVRTAVEPLTLAAAVRQAVWDIDRDQPVSSIRAMREVFDAELANRNTQLTLVGAFAVLALVLAALGLYSVLSYTVLQRTPEIGLRMALGAPSTSVVRDIVRGALQLAGSGLVLGLIGALAVTRVVNSFLFGISATDPTTFIAAALALLFVAGLAAYVPARRAARIDPVTAMRGE